jgi:hypothetical protein
MAMRSPEELDKHEQAGSDHDEPDYQTDKVNP